MGLSRVGLLVGLCGIIGCSGSTGGDAGTCSGATKTPPNLVPNDGFECGDMGWSPQAGTLTADPEGRTGAKSAKLVATNALGGKFGLVLPVVTSTSGKVYCAQAYFRGTVANAQLAVYEDQGGAGTIHTFSTPVASATWVRTPPSTNLEVRAAAGAKLLLQVLMKSPNVNDTLFVDDVDVWESADGLCKETR